MRRFLLAFLVSLLGAGALTGAAHAAIGQPVPDGLGLQTPVTEVAEGIVWFHDVIVLPVMVVVSLFVLALMAWIIVRYNKHANKNPKKFSHNTTLEVVWTLVPVLILVGISYYSFPELYRQLRVPEPDLTVKAIGNQWYWEYEYPEQGLTDANAAAIVSNMVPEDEARAAGLPAYLAVDNPLVVPVGAVVEVQVTAKDVIHNWAVPSFGVRIDTIPGRLNHTWFKVDRPGIYYGQCSELCGARHAYMPIQVNVVSEAEFEAYVRGRQAEFGVQVGLGLDEDETDFAEARMVAPAEAQLR